jgi:hypothetical protein
MSNPYQSPQVPPEPWPPELPSHESRQRENVGTSVFFILVGAFFCVMSGYVLLGSGLAAELDARSFMAVNRRGDWSGAYMFFYCVAGGLTSVFHICYLLFGCPAQRWAGIWAIVVSLGLTGLVFGVLTFFAA